MFQSAEEKRVFKFNQTNWRLQILVNLNSLQTATVNLAVNKLRDLDVQLVRDCIDICSYMIHKCSNCYNQYVDIFGTFITNGENIFSHQNTKTYPSPPYMKLVLQNRVPISQHWPHLESKVHRRWSMPSYMYNQQLPYGCSSLQNNNPKCINSKLVVSSKRFDLDINKQHLLSAFELFSLMLFIFT